MISAPQSRDQRLSVTGSVPLSHVISASQSRDQCMLSHPKRKSLTLSIVSPSIFYEGLGPGDMTAHIIIMKKFERSQESAKYGTQTGSEPKLW